MPAYYNDQAFGDRFALAVIRTASNPDAAAPEMTGSYEALQTVLKVLGGGLDTLRAITSLHSRSDSSGKIELAGDTWTFTRKGASEYIENLHWARKYLSNSHLTKLTLSNDARGKSQNVVC